MTTLQQRFDVRCTADQRPRLEALAMLSGELRGSTDRDTMPDPPGICPVCGNRYQPDEGVVALELFSVSASGAQILPVVADCDQGSAIVLGHRDCVVPRLLSLLGRGHLEDRFPGSAEVTVGESVFPEGYYDTP